MKCKYHYVEKRKTRQLGGKEPTIDEDDLCRLRMKSAKKESEVHEALVKKGLEGEWVEDMCPVARIGRWKECPFFEPME